MQRLWYQLRLGWDGLRRLPFVARRTPVAWLGVLLATMALFGGLALVLRTPPPSGQVQAPLGEGGQAQGPTTLPGTPPGGGQPGPGQPGADLPGDGPAIGAQPGGGGAGGGAGPGEGPVTTPADATPTTAPVGAPPTTAPGGGEPTTTGTPGSSTSTTCTTKPEVTVLPPISVSVSVSLTLPLPLHDAVASGGCS